MILKAIIIETFAEMFTIEFKSLFFNKNKHRTLRPRTFYFLSTGRIQCEVLTTLPILSS